MIVERGYLDHWKTNLLRQLTGLAYAAEMPLRLWEHCEARRDDFIADRDGLIVAGICRAALPPKDLIAALLTCRWIVKVKGGFLVHGWRERNASWLAKIEGGKTRAANAKRDATGKLASSNGASSHPASSPASRDTLQLAGNTAGAVEWSGVEWSGVEWSGDTPPSPSVRASAADLESTWTLILSVLKQKKRRPGYDAEMALSRQADHLPLCAEDSEALTWFYGLPHEERDVDLRSRFRDADKLAVALFPAIERAHAYSKKTGRGEKNGAAAEPEPGGWRDAMASVYPGSEVPETWAEFCRLGASIRGPVLRRLSENGGAA